MLGVSAERAVASAAFEIMLSVRAETFNPRSLSECHDHVGIGFEQRCHERARRALRRVGSHRAWMLAPGVVAIASGVIGIVVLFSLAIVDVKYIGVLLWTAGFAQVAVVPRAKAGRVPVGTSPSPPLTP